MLRYPRAVRNPAQRLRRIEATQTGVLRPSYEGSADSARVRGGVSTPRRARAHRLAQAPQPRPRTALHVSPAAGASFVRFHARRDRRRDDTLGQYMQRFTIDISTDGNSDVVNLSPELNVRLRDVRGQAMA